jgi:Zn-dependent protease with chaperone function
MNKELENRYKNVIEDNINVGKSNVGTELLIMLVGLIGILLCIFIFADTITNCFIGNMSDKTQVKIENLFIDNMSKFAKPPKNIQQLETIKQNIISLDKNLQNKSKFSIFEYPTDEINAFVTPNGTIYFTSGLLKDVQDNEILTFIMAHELGHYAHRDHLKQFSREIIANALISVISTKDVNITIKGISEINSLKYSREQETAADLYANKVVLRLYGKNTGGIKFFEFLEKREGMPEFVKYFSTHPSTKDRLELLKHKKK